MAYKDNEFSGFGGGLNLRDKTDAISGPQAIDGLNFVLTERGSVGQRAGYKKLTAAELTIRADSLAAFGLTTGTRQLLAGCGTRLEAIATNGTIVSSATGLTGGPYAFARFGTPNLERAYTGNGTDTLRRWDGAAWSAPTATVDTVAALAMPKAGCLAVQTIDNRLVCAGFATTTGGPNGAPSSPSHVYFSDAGDPESYTTNNNEILHPGDGEKIMNVVAWRELIFVFKETKFFVFYGNSTDQHGNPVFNYRTVASGHGLASKRGVAVGRDGVYFIDKTGVYKTTGQEPKLISSLIDPIFVGNPEIFYTGGILNQAQISQVALGWKKEQLFIGFPADNSTTNNRTLLFDIGHDWWSLYDFPAAAFATFQPESDEELHFAYASGLKHIARHNDNQTNDDGSATQSHWTSGWIDFKSPNEKTVREMKVWGKGKVDIALAVDFGFPIVYTTVNFDQGIDLWGDGSDPNDLWGDGSNPADLWGPSSAINPRLVSDSRVGTVYATTFKNSILDQSWQIHRLTHSLREERPSHVLIN